MWVNVTFSDSLKDYLNIVAPVAFKTHCFFHCDWRDDIEVVLQRVREGDADPHCSCGGLLKSATVSFGQNLFPGDIDRMFDASLSCDLLLAVGTSLQVFPVAEMVPTAVNNGAKTVIVNGESTVMDHLAEIVVNGEISKVLPQIVSLYKN